MIFNTESGNNANPDDELSLEKKNWLIQERERREEEEEKRRDDQFFEQIERKRQVNLDIQELERKKL